MLNVKREICAGCGVCTRVCPTDAISLDRGKARIDQAKCNDCYRCIQACPRGAIVVVEAGLEQPAVPSIHEPEKQPPTPTYRSAKGYSEIEKSGTAKKDTS